MPPQCTITRFRRSSGPRQIFCSEPGGRYRRRLVGAPLFASASSPCDDAYCKLYPSSLVLRSSDKVEPHRLLTCVGNYSPFLANGGCVSFLSACGLGAHPGFRSRSSPVNASRSRQTRTPGGFSNWPVERGFLQPCDGISATDLPNPDAGNEFLGSVKGPRYRVLHGEADAPPLRGCLQSFAADDSGIHQLLVYLPSAVSIFSSGSTPGSESCRLHIT